MTPEEQFLTGQNLPGSGPDGGRLPSADELFSTRPSASPAEIRHAMLAQMGQEFGSSPSPRTPEYPGIHQLAQDLGLA